MNSHRLDIILSALACPSRRAVFDLIRESPGITVTVLAAAVGQPQNVASNHLTRLRMAGLIETEKDGRLVHCSARPGALAPLGAYAHERREVAHA